MGATMTIVVDPASHQRLQRSHVRSFKELGLKRLSESDWLLVSFGLFSWDMG